MEHSADAVAQRGLDRRPRERDVGFPQPARVADAGAAEPRQVDHRVRGPGLDPRLSPAYVAGDERDLLRPGEDLEVRRIPVTAQRVDREHVVSGAGQGRAQVGADEAGAAGDRDLHAPTLCAVPVPTSRRP